jgi:hypothetical protein
VPGTFSFHVPLGGWRSPIEARFMRGLGVVPGIPDVLSIRDGRLYALELKVAGGRPSPAQIEANKLSRAAGAEVTTVVGLDAALEQLAAWNLLRGST